MLRRPDSRYHRVKHPPQRCLDLGAILINHMLEDRCRKNKEGGGVDDPTVNFCEFSSVGIRIEPPDQKDAHINLDIVFYGGKICRFSFYEAHEDNRVCQMEQENGPEIGRCVQVQEIHHYLFTKIFRSLDGGLFV